MEAASVTTILQVSQKSFSADSSCACIRRAAAFATKTGGSGGICTIAYVRAAWDKASTQITCSCRFPDVWQA